MLVAERPRVTEYIRFEIYIPTYYTVSEHNQETQQVEDVIHAVDPVLLAEFLSRTLAVFQGVTQSNPAAPSPFKGSWQHRAGGPVLVDHLTAVVVLVRQQKFEEALAHFDFWKTELEKGLHQQIILITFSVVHVLSVILQM